MVGIPHNVAATPTALKAFWFVHLTSTSYIHSMYLAQPGWRVSPVYPQSEAPPPEKALRTYSSRQTSGRSTFPQRGSRP